MSTGHNHDVEDEPDHEPNCQYHEEDEPDDESNPGVRLSTEVFSLASILHERLHAQRSICLNALWFGNPAKRGV